MKVALVFLFIAFLLFSADLLAQEQEKKKLEINGYISSLQSAMFDSIQENWVTESLIHNRINFKWFPVSTVTGALELRNRIAFGDGITMNPNAGESYTNDNGIVNLSTNLFQGKSYIVNSSIDRLWIAYEKNKWRVTLGRQRINWSQTWVWNPNDIFNAYSFFDFDYAERPGSDAIRVQYYNTEVSTTECAVKMNSENQVTAAGYYKFNKWGYDFQVLGGVLNQTDYVIGAGWSGAIKRLAVRGEMSYFKPVENFKDTTGFLLASFAMDYSFGNSMSVMAEFLYNGAPTPEMSDFLSYYSAPMTVKNLSFVTYNLLLQATYPITPLFTGTLAGMYFPPIKGYYLGPALSYSASDNIEVSTYLQSFGGKITSESGEIQKLRFNMLFLRVKVSF